MKFFIVLKNIGKTIMLASLPTSKDHIPQGMGIESGCVHSEERGVNAFIFGAGQKVTNEFHFRLPTFIYGEQIDEYEIGYIENMSGDVEDLGIITPDLFSSLIECIKKSILLKKRYKRLL